MITNNDNNIAELSSVWDLHIHTCECPKGSSEFSKMNLDEYINKICHLFSLHKELKMISFTDHNLISKNVYEAFAKKNTGIKLIPGVEVDIYLNSDYQEKKKFKHIIFYFDDNKFNLEKHSSLINEELTKAPMLLHDFLDFLLTKVKVPFLVSPHFMKQQGRGIEYDWDEIKTKENIDKYIDQMCCFWEASSNSAIQKAIDFLVDFDRENKVSVISFSDSNCLEKMQKYLDNPHQYFHSLPTFNGIRLVGTDCTRISFTKKVLNDSDKAKYIGSVKQGSNVINFSSGLNSIIGGRGSGKSLLLDGIYLFLNKRDKALVDSKRRSFIKNLNFTVSDLSNNDLANHKFNVDYYNQGFVQQLFTGKTNLSEMPYFSDVFKSLKPFNEDSLRQALKNKIKIKNKKCSVNTNLVGITNKIIKLENEGKDLNINNSYPFESIIEYKKRNELVSEVKEAFNSKIIEDKEFINKVNELIDVYYRKLNELNINTISDTNFLYVFKTKYLNLINKKSDIKSTKIMTTDLLKSKFSEEFYPIKERINIIESLINLHKYIHNESDEKCFNGYKDRKFKFLRTLTYQKIVLYIKNTLLNYFDSTKIKSKFKVSQKNDAPLKELLMIYLLYPEDFLQESKKIEELNKELTSLVGYEIKVEEDIILVDKNKESKLSTLSPGTRANLLLEYIVYNENEKPLLIDQPEDNIDNQTIYNDLTKWFRNLKNKRQVIVATHDANIVVNSDSENVIICNQTDNGFAYTNGALEYSDNLEKVSNILDGGKDAIERRLLKYGK